MSAPCPFAQWGLDIVGPFPPASGGRKFLFVAIDYFTMRVEAEPTSTITAAKTLGFIWTSIFCRFGVPMALVMDNGKQFENDKVM